MSSILDVVLKVIIDLILPVALLFGIDSTSNKNKHQETSLGDKDDRRVWLIILPHSCAD